MSMYCIFFWRFQQIESRWGYSGTSDKIRFIVDRRIFVVGFGLYGSIHGPSEYDVTIQVWCHLDGTRLFICFYSSSYTQARAGWWVLMRSRSQVTAPTPPSGRCSRSRWRFSPTQTTPLWAPSRAWTVTTGPRGWGRSVWTVRAGTGARWPSSSAMPLATTMAPRWRMARFLR